MDCYCGSQKNYQQCCGPFIEGHAQPSTPEELMRSRYTAFALKKVEYIKKTHDPLTAGSFDFDSNRLWAHQVDFIRLDVVNHQTQGNTGTVEFKAYYRDNDQVHCHHEVSTFRYDGQTWYYSSGKYP